MSIEELTKLLSKDYDEKLVVDVVRYYIDKGLITIDLNKLAINPN